MANLSVAATNAFILVYSLAEPATFLELAEHRETILRYTALVCMLF